MSLPAAGYLNNAARTEGEMKTAFEDQLKGIKQIPGAGVAAQTLTLASDAITPALGGSGILIIDTEAAAGTDNLATIGQTNFDDNSLIVIRIANNARVVVVKHNAGGTGQISLASGADFTLSDTKLTVTLRRNGTLWEQVTPAMLALATLVSNLVSANPAVALGVASKQYVDAYPGTVLIGGKVTVTMAANAVTLAVKTLAGADPSPTDPVTVRFRHATLTDGSTVSRQITAALSTVISSGSTGGTVNALPARIYFGVLDNAGAVELCWWNPLTSTLALFAWSESGLITTLAEGGAGAADSAGVIYSTTARSNVAGRYAGYFECTQATAGTWATAASLVQQMGVGVRRTGDRVQSPLSTDGAAASGTTTLPLDDTIPQNTEGVQFMTLPITPTSAINLLSIAHIGMYTSGNATNATIQAALFQDSVANALAAIFCGRVSTADVGTQISLNYRMRAGTVSSTTFNIRAGTNSAGTTRFNSDSSGRLYGGVAASFLSIEELFV